MTDTTLKLYLVELHNLENGAMREEYVLARSIARVVEEFSDLDTHKLECIKLLEVETLDDVG